MSMEKFYSKPHLSIIVSIIVIIWLFIIFILSYVIYNLVFHWKIYKNFPSSSDWFIEYNLWDIDIIKDYFPADYIPWYFSYIDKFDKNDKWAILFFKWEKIDVIELAMLESWTKLFNKLKHNSEQILISWSYIELSQSSIPPCISKKNLLFCTENKDILEDILKDDTNMRDDNNFTTIENNLYRQNMLIAYFNSEFINKFSYLEWRFRSAWISLKHNWSEIDWIFYWSLDLENEINDKQVRKYNLESYINTEDWILFFWWRDFQKQFNEMIDNMSINKPYLILLAKWLLDAKLKEFFWWWVKFVDDILPLFSWEFLIAVKEIDKVTHLELILEKTNSIQYLLDNFENETKKYMPIKEEYNYGIYDLKQISSDASNIENIDKMKNWKKIKWWTVKWKDHWLYLIEDNDLFKISTSLEVLEAWLFSEKTSLKDLLPYSPYSYDFWYVNFPKLNSLIEIMEDEPISHDIHWISWQSMWSNNWIQVKFRIFD